MLGNEPNSREIPNVWTHACGSRGNARYGMATMMPVGRQNKGDACRASQRNNDACGASIENNKSDACRASQEIM